MDESSSNKHTGTEVLAEEEDLWWDFHPLDFFRNDWESAATNGSKEDDDYGLLAFCWYVKAWSKLTNCSNVQGKVVKGSILLTSATGFHCVGHFFQKFTDKSILSRERVI